MGEQNWYAVHDLTNFFNFYYMKEDHRSYRRNSFAVEKRKPEKFLFETAKVASITAMIFFHIILHHEVLIYDFHIFIIILLQVYNEPIQRPAPSWLVSSTDRALHLYRRGKGFESRTSPRMFFHAFFSQLQKLRL